MRLGKLDKSLKFAETWTFTRLHQERFFLSGSGDGVTVLENG